MAPLNLCFYILFYVFLLSLFTRLTSALFIYDKRTLLDIGHRCTNLLLDTLSTDPAWPLEILRNAEVTKATRIIPEGERNTADDVLESVTDWETKLTAPLSPVFCSQMSNPWKIRWTTLEPGQVSNETLGTVTSFVCLKHGSLPRPGHRCNSVW